MKILVTGVAGFIGYHCAARLLRDGHTVIGLDNLNDYYNPSLKRARLGLLMSDPEFRFCAMDLSDRASVTSLFEKECPQRVLHLGAQAGVRYSLQNPHAYIESNVVGFLHILEGARHGGVEHLVYASSSSVYGLNETMPYRVQDNVDHPISLYAATKKSNELFAHTYSHLYALPTTGLRFFTVYGPWGRPDMAYWKFTRSILLGEPIEVYAMGEQQRDFTYIDDIVEGVVRLLDHPAKPNPSWTGASPDTSTSRAPYRVYNIGNHRPVALIDFIRMIEEAVGRKAKMRMLPAQAGDVSATAADVEPLRQAIDFAPSTPLAEGIKTFVDWYKSVGKDF